MTKHIQLVWLTGQDTFCVHSDWGLIAMPSTGQVNMMAVLVARWLPDGTLRRRWPPHPYQWRDAILPSRNAAQHKRKFVVALRGRSNCQRNAEEMRCHVDEMPSSYLLLTYLVAMVIGSVCSLWGCLGDEFKYAIRGLE